MQVDDAMQAALVAAGLPDAALFPAIDGVVSPIHRAVENHCCLATGEGRSPVFLKRRHDDMTAFIMTDRVAEASRKAGELGIAPPLLHADSTNGILVFEALGEDWTWGRADVLRRPQVFENLVAAKRAFHAAAPLTETRTVFDLVTDYRRLSDAPDVVLPPPVFTVVSAVSQIALAVAAAGVDTVACHADGASSNVMVGPGNAIRLVDFEWARQADPAHDLGTLLAELLPFDGEALMAIEIATGRPDAQVLARARLYGAADDLMWALWGFISAARSPRKHVEFFKYAEWRLLRARTVVEGPCFESWMKKL
jgi:hypothetical protein